MLMTDNKDTGGSASQTGGEGQQGSAGKETTSAPKSVIAEQIDKASYKGPVDSKPMQPEQVVTPNPTNQQGGDTGGGAGQQSGGTSDGGQGSE